MSVPGGANNLENRLAGRLLIDDEVAAITRTWAAQQRLRRRILLRARGMTWQVSGVTAAPALRSGEAGTVARVEEDASGATGEVR
jgi:hypothetical protein